jgi:hypothetical protein
MTVTRYVHPDNDMTAEVSFEKDDEFFHFSTVVYKNGRPYSHVLAKCVSDEGHNMLASVIGGINNSGFLPEEEF